MTHFLRPLCAAVLLATLSSACLTADGAGESGDGNGKPMAMAAEMKAPAKAGDPKQEAAPEVATDAAADAKKAQRKAEKQQREVTYATMELALAEMDAERELRDATQDVQHAKQELEAAELELAHFKQVERLLELEDQQIDLDRAVQAAAESKSELDEIMAMYKADDFAKMTRELVVQREKFRMEIAQRMLALAKKRAADKQSHDWAVKERDLTQAREKASAGVASAEDKLKKTRASNELDLLRARHKLEEAQRGEDDDSKDA